MSPVSEWLDMMPDEVTFQTRTGRDAQGGPVFSSTAVGPYPCRIEMKNRLIVDKSGRQVLAKGRVIMGTTYMPSVEDKIILPSEYVPVSPPMLAVNKQPDEDGSHHVSIDIG